ncbi:NAD kinase [Brevibacterium sp. 5221]|uniref:NAD kinase n=2 Tax=Brevibacteriaceae TaxID=85019 RepID=A0A6N9H759_9MICO|nr:NAD kinase [Brevibacterium rongguiense]WAL41604.1 NAD kinase [Brevibacterium sp. BRM-1]
MVVVLHPHRAAARAAALTVCARLAAEGIEARMLESDYRALVEYEDQPEVPISVIPDSAPNPDSADVELVMVLGGDGTILRAAEHFHGSQVPIMGINLGHVGFLAESERKDLELAVRRAADRDYEVEQRMALDIAVSLGDEVIHRGWALNEATIEKSRDCSMIELALGVDARPVTSFGADGVILATPTGSTAYAFSAGGPIVWPEVEALLMVPISAHALFAKPMVVAPDARLGVEFASVQPDASAELWCDGRRILDLPRGARIEAVKSATPVPLARLNMGEFSDRLVAKFHLPVAGWRGPAVEP